jgi:hypothetical protein
MRIFKEYKDQKVNEAKAIAGEPLKEDLESIKKHINNVVLKPYKVKVEVLSLHRDYGDSQTFISNPVTGAGLGIFGPAIEYAQINLVISNLVGKSNAKEIELLIKYTTKNNLNNSFPAGKYLLQDATIRFISSEENMPIEEVGESKFAVLSHEEI